MKKFLPLMLTAMIFWGCNKTIEQTEASDTHTHSSPLSDAGFATREATPSDAGPGIPDSGNSITNVSDAGYQYTPPVPRLDGGHYEAPVHLTLGTIIPPGDNSDGSLELWITNRVSVAGTQLRITGVTPKPGPTAGGIIGALEGWNSQVAIDGMYLSFYLTGNPIPPSDGVLTVIPLVSVNAHEICVTDAVVSDPDGNEIEHSMGCLPAP